MKQDKEKKEKEAVTETETPNAQETQPQDAADTPEENTAAQTAPEEDSALLKAQESVKNLTDRLMRTAAEFDNFKKRSAREKDDIYSVAVCDTIAKLLPVLDNLDRALAAGEENPDKNGLFDGVKMVKKQFEDALSDIGVTAMDAVGSPFDPEKHNAVMTEESDAEENTVLEELMRGYLYKDKVIRHSMVKVSK